MAHRVEESAPVNNKMTMILGIAWIALGVWTATIHLWVGIAMCVSGVAYLVYAVYTLRREAQRA